MKRWLTLSVLLSAGFWLVTGAALRLWPVRPLSNLAEFFMFPSSLLSWQVWPRVNDHAAPSFDGARCLLAGAFWAAALLLGWSFWQRQRQPLDAARRRLLVAGATVPLTGAALYATALAPRELEIRRYEVPLRGLPAALDGLKLGHLSDTHYGPMVGMRHIRAAIALLNAEKVDLQLLTGDFVHKTPDSIPGGVRVLTECRSRFGSLAVLGNHDHWEGEVAVRREFSRHGLSLIDGERVFLTPEGLSSRPRPNSLAVCGVDDLWTGRLAVEEALRDVPEECPRLLLSHNPDIAELIPRGFPGRRFDLQLSGHTHGGQVLVPGVGALVTGSEFGNRYLGGLVQGPRWPVIVSRGVGVTILPVRLGVPPEVGIITLRSS